MHPKDENLANMTLCYMDGSGKLHPLQLGTAEIAPDAENSKEEEHSPLLCGWPGEPFTATIPLRAKHGAIDCLFNRPTLAAYRYRRLQIRHKEEARRKKLKEMGK